MGPVTEDATACAERLENMLSHSMSQCAVSSQEPLVAMHPHFADFKLNVMFAWCKSVALGRIPHGPLLAHANMKGDDIVMHPSGQHMMPNKERYNVWSEYPWGAHGEYGVALVSKFFVQLNVWPKDIMPVASLVPVAPARTQQEHNMCCNN